ncbi:Uncharacterized protein M6B38_111190 [Iris pallida]|uniref:Uncharacterized protein n=1 Tax=Iris pallida TaxID=29817 RepID=A0AAX6DMX4_IRIPA|nr:Uncharacterized protein M6B38_111190 [Iris pallida]
MVFIYIIPSSPIFLPNNRESPIFRQKQSPSSSPKQPRFSASIATSRDYIS